MSLESLRVCRNVLLRAFMIGVAIAILYAIAAVLGWETWSSLFSDRWHLADRSTLRFISLAWFAAARFFLVFVLLVPAVAFHWTLEREKGRSRP